MEDDDATAPRGRGRPAHQPTSDLKARVADLVRQAADVTTIAAAIGISEPTLRQYYADELDIERPQLGFGFVGNDLGDAPERDGPKGGRPSHKPTKNSRERVEILVASGMFAFQIAAALDISEPTLREHYGHELLVGGSRKKAQMLEAMFTSGIAGNATSMRAWLAQAHDISPDAPERPQPAGKAPPKLGKKEQEMADARQPNTGTRLGALMAKRLGLDGSDTKH